MSKGQRIYCTCHYGNAVAHIKYALALLWSPSGCRASGEDYLDMMDGGLDKLLAAQADFNVAINESFVHGDLIASGPER